MLTLRGDSEVDNRTPVAVHSVEALRQIAARPPTCDGTRARFGTCWRRRCGGDARSAIPRGACNLRPAPRRRLWRQLLYFKNGAWSLRANQCRDGGEAAAAALGRGSILFC